MIYVDVVYQTKYTKKWIRETKEFSTKEVALRAIYGLRDKGFIIDGYRCDDYTDAQWLDRRVKL
ncbi:MAG: hypothetical protein J6S67_01750 [Methanobrevibacter sp.]|nr:hypothetical protein [Methanobrevibacter sp.]